MSAESMIWEKETFSVRNEDDKRGDVTLVRWDDRGRMINQQQADQDVADKVSEKSWFQRWGDAFRL